MTGVLSPAVFHQNKMPFIVLVSLPSGNICEMKTTEGDMHRQHTSSVGLWPADSWEHSCRETSSQWTLLVLESLLLRLHYTSFIEFSDPTTKIWSAIYSTLYLKSTFMHILHQYLYKSLLFSSVCTWHKPTEDSRIIKGSAQLRLCSLI